MIDTDHLIDAMPYARTLGIVLEQATPQEVLATLDWREDRCTAGGVMHGGALLSLADSAGALCAYLNLLSGAATSTIDSAATFLRPIRTGTARATSRALHTGRSVIAVRTEVTDDQGRLAAHVVQTQAVLESRASD